MAPHDSLGAFPDSNPQSRYYLAQGAEAFSSDVARLSALGVRVPPPLHLFGLLLLHHPWQIGGVMGAAFLSMFALRVAFFAACGLN